MLSGDNGILTKATQSKEETRGGSVQEQRDLWKLEQVSDQYTKTQSAKSLATLLQELGPNGQKLLTAEEIETINETGQVTIGSKTIIFKEILTIGSEYDKGNIKIGDKLSYSANGVNDWIVFGKDGSSNVLLTTEAPISNYTPICNAEHWVKWEEDLDNLCSSYGKIIQNIELKSRSITLADINNVTGFIEPTFPKYKFTTDSDANYSSQKVNYYYPDKNAANNSPYQYLQRATTSEIEVNENSNDIPAKEFLYNIYSYYKDNDGLYKMTLNGASTTINLSKANNMKFVVGENFDWRYFIASKSVEINSNYAMFYVAAVSNGKISQNGGAAMCGCFANFAHPASGAAAGVRPIVEIPYNIEVQELSSGVYDIAY